MKKTLLSTLIVSVLLLSGCDKKVVPESAALKQKDAQIQKLENTIKVLKVKMSQMNPAIVAKKTVVFEKNEKITVPVDGENMTTPVGYLVSTLKTNVDWLDELLLKQLYDFFNQDNNIKIESTKQLLNELNDEFKVDVEAVKEAPVFEIDYNLKLEFLGQKGNIAEFVRSGYEYSGGAHGNYATQYINVDLNRKGVIQLNDLFSKDNQKELKNLLWDQFAANNRNSEGGVDTTYVTQKELRVPNNFYFSQKGMVFVYPLYELGPYAEGEKELILSWEQVRPLFYSDITPDFYMGSNAVN